MSALKVSGAKMQFNKVLVVIKQTAFEEYSQVRAMEYRERWLLIERELSLTNSFFLWIDS